METVINSIVADNEDNQALSEVTTIEVSPPSQSSPNRECLEFWESAATRPIFAQQESAISTYFENAGQQYLQRCMEHPTLSIEEIREQKFERIRFLVELAYNDIPVYKEKYQKAGFKPSDLRSFADIERIPVITKSELIEAFPDRCLNPLFKREELFPTRSSGSSGQTLLIRVNEEAILMDTMQGVRQFALQSGFNYKAEDLLAHVYTVPWWFNSVAGAFPTAFISNVIPPAQVAKHLGTIAPQVLSCYPSNLEALLPYKDQFNKTLYLVVTHSEYSSRSSRQEWSKQLGCPVLDEYSSEEGTRMALELPCGHYHVCEDTVHLEVLDPLTLKEQIAGVSGIGVITNFLNTAMPFIRYVQGDCLTIAAQPESCGINWTVIHSIDGRLNDAFINAQGRKVPAGSILDITYRWMFDRDLHLSQFELVQKRSDVIEAKFVLGSENLEERLKNSISHLESLLAMCMENPVKVQAFVVPSFPQTTGKRRPIRCEVSLVS